MRQPLHHKDETEQSQHIKHGTGLRSGGDLNQTEEDAPQYHREVNARVLVVLPRDDRAPEQEHQRQSEKTGWDNQQTPETAWDGEKGRDRPVNVQQSEAVGEGDRGDSTVVVGWQVSEQQRRVRVYHSEVKHHSHNSQCLAYWWLSSQLGKGAVRQGVADGMWKDKGKADWQLSEIVLKYGRLNLAGRPEKTSAQHQ